MTKIVDWVVNHRVPVLIGVLLFSCTAGFVASESYRLIVESRFRSAEQALIREHAFSLEGVTLKGRSMGALSLAGLLNSSVRTASLETDIGHAKQFNIARPALQVIARRLGANVTFVVNEQGIITSDWDRAHIQTVGLDVSRRPYFAQAMKGLPSVQGGVSSTTGRLMYYVAAPVFLDSSGEEVTGAVVGRFEASELDEFVANDGMRTGLLISPQGVVFTAGRADWRLRTTGVKTPDEIRAIAEGGQYGTYFNDAGQVKALPFNPDEQIVRVEGQRYAVSSAPVDWNDPQGQWRLLTISPLAPVYDLLEGVLIALLTVGCIGLLLGFGLWRITDMRRRRADSEEIVRQHQRLQLVLDNAPVAVCIIRDDLQPDTSGMVRFVNPLFTNSFDVRVNAPMPLLYVRPEERATLRERLRTEGVVAQHETQVFDNRHQVRDALVNFMRIDFQGEMGTLAWLIDITERKTAEREMLKAMNAAEAATKIKGEFLANMSHEIRTPMNAILGMSSLALQSELNASQRNYIEKVHQAANSLLDVINDILDFSKLESAKMEIEHAPFQLDDVFGDVANAISLRAAQKNLELLFDIRPDVPASLSGDRLRLGQVLINLGNNAVKFTDRGEVIIGVEVAARQANRITLHFWVTDTGIGLTDEHKAKLFNSFTQADSSTTRRFGGSGLGLVISKQLVELMDGHIRVASQFGVGSTFHFEVVLDEVPLAPPAVAANAELQQCRLLLVDDNASTRAVVQAMAAAHGLQLEAAANGIEALIAVDEVERAGGRFDVILMDWQMPIMDGLQCAELVRQRTQHSGVKVLMLTAPGGEEAERLARLPTDVIIDGVLTKPLLAATLLTAVGAVLGTVQAPHITQWQGPDFSGDIRERLAGNRVLLVEDNEMNQELAVALLTQAGLTVTVAGNGQVALDILAADNDFGCVLMDCQMPVMDGYTATQKIRADQATHGLPVIAMTASAMKGDMEKALAVGMDDYITKPLNVGSMFAIIGKWIRPVRSQAVQPAAAPGGEANAELPPLPGIDVQAGMAVCMNNVELYRKMLVMFLQEAQTFEAQFAAQVAAADKVAMVRLAHTLKGTAGNIGATGVQGAAHALQWACEDEGGQGYAAPLHALLSELAIVVGSLRSIEF